MRASATTLLASPPRYVSAKPTGNAEGSEVDISDRLNDLKRKAEDAAVEHKDQLKKAVDKAQATADQRTDGKYHEQIVKAGAKVQEYVENLKPQDDAAAPPSPHDE